jgi:hypothetical protein
MTIFAISGEKIFFLPWSQFRRGRILRNCLPRRIGDPFVVREVSAAAPEYAIGI